VSYAQGTEVPIERSKAEIERMISKFGAQRFMTGSEPGKAMLAFQIKNKMVQFVLPLPDQKDQRFWVTPQRRYKRTADEAYKEWEQACRSRWRALYLVIKAKLEAIESGITSFEAEFLAHFVLPNGQTVGSYVIPKLEEATSSGRMPQLQIGFPEPGGQP
jgi:hypothetical protein